MRNEGRNRGQRRDRGEGETRGEKGQREALMFEGKARQTGKEGKVLKA